MTVEKHRILCANYTKDKQKSAVLSKFLGTKHNNIIKIKINLDFFQSLRCKHLTLIIV